MKLSRKTNAEAVRHLSAADPVLGELIDRVGPCTLRPERDRFGMLVRSIISQQISTQAARAVRRRLDALVAPEPVMPESLARFSAEELRTAGLSPQKAASLLDLCAKVLEGRVRLERIGRLGDDAVIAELVQVRGIGRWTAQMFLIFALGRPDVFPHDDLGVRVALRDLYGLPGLPDRETSHHIAAPWRPYASVASWYCWRTGDLKRNERPDASRYPV